MTKMHKGRYVYRAVYQHNGKDAGLVGRGCESVSRERCRSFAEDHTRGRGTYRIRRYLVTPGAEAAKGGAK